MSPVSYGGQRRPLRRRWIRPVVIVIVLILVLLGGRSWLSTTLEKQMNSYIPFDNDPLVAQLSVKGTNTNTKWIIQLSIADRSGKLIANSQPFLESCDHWELNADVLSIQPSWLAFVLGVPSAWYMLNNLVGSHCYDTHGIPTTAPDRISLDASKDTVAQGGGFLRLMSSLHVTSNIIQADGKTYDAMLTLTSLSLIAAS